MRGRCALPWYFTRVSVVHDLLVPQYHICLQSIKPLTLSRPPRNVIVSNSLLLYDRVHPKHTFSAFSLSAALPLTLNA
ncbi:hypothetical protein TELCIR_16247 [Teladorsagia circumcincta]|uniref:Uncharacterized protein n=1 Tax=Teladorsagia circumcincta TaxID=45464 RepID=A0A2G9TW08_TELCI|nr:hypothetical protein TELCIR_16247 [Teladorsagia circumcincta]